MSNSNGNNKEKADSEAGGSGIDDGNVNAHFEQSTAHARGLLGRMFSSCQSDPRGSVHRAWGISLLFVVMYFVLAIIEMINLQSQGGSMALVIASVWTGIVHLALGVLGTFVLKRFPTSFSVGFLLGVLVILANQNLLLFGTFTRYRYGSPRTNQAFAGLAFTLCAILTFMALLLVHFKQDVVVSPLDATPSKGASANNNNTKEDDGMTESYFDYAAEGGSQKA